MKPQLYSIVILLLTRINYAQETSTPDAAVSGTQLPPIPTDNTTTVAEPPDDTSVTNAPDDHTTSAHETTEDNVTSVTKAPQDNTTSVTKAPQDNTTSVTKAPQGNTTSVTKAPQGNTTSVTKTSVKTMVSEIPTDKATVLSEAPNNQVTSTPSLAPNVSPVRPTEGFTMTSRSGGTPTATGSTRVSIGNQTSNPIVVGNATTQRINKVTKPVRKTTRLTSTKSTTGNRTSAFPVPSLFTIVLLVISVLCF